MNKCPQCGTSYTDRSLRFCLADGATLLPFSDEPDTQISGRRDAVRVNVPQNEPVRTASVTAPKENSSLKKLIAVLGTLVALGLIVVLIAVAVVIYMQRQENVNIPLSTPTPSPSPTVDAEKERLQNQLANLQKKLDERPTSETNRSPSPDSRDDLDEATTATVNSPGDGFLALRSEPDTETGERIAQIPHGSRLEVISCEPKRVKIGSRTGKWCLVEWSGRAGWVFDAWLTYR